MADVQYCVYTDKRVGSKKAKCWRNIEMVPKVNVSTFVPVLDVGVLVGVHQGILSILEVTDIYILLGLGVLQFNKKNKILIEIWIIIIKFENTAVRLAKKHSNNAAKYKINKKKIQV